MPRHLRKCRNYDITANTYADDTAVWVITEDIKEAQRELQRLADAMAKYTRDSGH
jgi:hypothetical protein